jgi:hypothetical protein
MWPLVLNNSPPRLLLIAYILALPVVPVVWSSGNRRLLLAAGLATLAAQIAAFGTINFFGSDGSVRFPPKLAAIVIDALRTLRRY